MNPFLLVTVLGSALMALTGCNFGNDFHSKNLTSFTILRSDNPSMVRDQANCFIREQYGKVEVSVGPDIDAKKVTIRFDHTGLEARLDGQTVLSGAVVDLTQPRLLSIWGRDDEEKVYRIETTRWGPLLVYPPLLLVTDNPGLRLDHTGSLDSNGASAVVGYPGYFSDPDLAVTVSFYGSDPTLDGTPMASKLAYDYRTAVLHLPKDRDHVLELGSADGSRTAITLQPRIEPASSMKTLQTIDLYEPNSADYLTRIGWGETPSAVGGIVCRTYDRPYDRSHLYLRVVTTGWKTESGNLVLDPNNPNLYGPSPSNWFDFTKPVTVTVTAEDLTTKTYTLNLVVP